jgi:aryl-alcohol dehydrogenase-like predicted oxidoreductase
LSGVPPALNQVGFSLFDRRWEADGFDACRELGVGVMAYGALAHGLPTGSVTRSTVLDATDWRAAGSFFGQPLLAPDNLDRNLEVVDQLRSLAARRGATLPQLALGWVLGRSPVAVALVGARSEREILEAVPAVDLRLSEADEREIDAVMAQAAGRTEMLPE